MPVVKGKERKEKLDPKFFAILGLFLLAVFIFLDFIFLSKPQFVKAANSPSVITYQGKLLESGLLATTTQSMYFILYNSLTDGSALYTAAGSLGVPQPISVTPSQGLFNVDLGGSGTNSLDPTIFRDNSGVYLEVRIGAQTLSPRKQITVSPYAFNARFLDGVGRNTVSSSTYIPTSDSSGNFTFNSTTISTSTISRLVVNGSVSLPANSISATELTANSVSSSELQSTGVTSGTYGSATQVSTFVVDDDGRITSAVNTLISINANQVTAGTLSNTRGGTGQDSSSWTGFVKVTNGTWSTSTITTFDVSGLGTIATQNANSVTISGGSIAGITDLTLADGGTGASLSAVNGGIVYSGASALAISLAGSSGQILQSSGAGAPVWVSTSSLGLAAGDHGHDSDYVNVTGDTMTGGLSVNSMAITAMTVIMSM